MVELEASKCWSTCRVQIPLCYPYSDCIVAINVVLLTIRICLLLLPWLLQLLFILIFLLSSFSLFSSFCLLLLSFCSYCWYQGLRKNVCFAAVLPQDTSLGMDQPMVSGRMMTCSACHLHLRLLRFLNTGHLGLQVSRSFLDSIGLLLRNLS